VRRRGRLAGAPHKASDLRREFSAEEYQAGDIILSRSGEPVDLRGPNAQVAKFGNNLCARCNNERSQPFDRAYDRFIEWFLANEVAVEDSGLIPLNDVFEDWEEGSTLVISYYAKSRGTVGVRFQLRDQRHTRRHQRDPQGEPDRPGHLGQPDARPGRCDGDPAGPTPDRTRQLDQLSRPSGLLAVADRLPAFMDQSDRPDRRTAEDRTGGAGESARGVATAMTSGSMQIGGCLRPGCRTPSTSKVAAGADRIPPSGSCGAR
jgi:hypothetical protein